MPAETTKSLESWLWDAACSIRGAKDASKFKDYILPLVFTKRLTALFRTLLHQLMTAQIRVGHLDSADARQSMN
jgi:type I restriction-modification system DNA methylase subunit